jgi:hypothetical protein
LTEKYDKSNEMNGSKDKKEMSGIQMKETRERKGLDRNMKEKERKGQEREEKN